MCVATLPCEMSSVLKATIENKTTSVTTRLMFNEFAEKTWDPGELQTINSKHAY